MIRLRDGSNDSLYTTYDHEIKNKNNIDVPVQSRVTTITRKSPTSQYCCQKSIFLMRKNRKNIIFAVTGSEVGRWP